MADNIRSEVQALRGEDLYINPEQFPALDNKYGLFSGTTCKVDDKEVEKIYKQFDRMIGSCRRPSQGVRGGIGNEPRRVPKAMAAILRFRMWVRSRDGLGVGEYPRYR